MRKIDFVARLEQKARRNRFRLFIHLTRHLERPIRILDVGGDYGFWEILDYFKLGEINVTLLNLYPQENLPPNFHSRVGDARSMHNFQYGDFDVVFSNSVIGHVGSFQDQKIMANEIRRIGRRYFIQTPNHYFPIDWRTRIPLFHFLPLKGRAKILQILPISPFGRFKSYSSAIKWASAVRNLSYRELRMLFPEAKIAKEKFLGFTKSFMIFHGFENSL